MYQVNRGKRAGFGTLPDHACWGTPEETDDVHLSRLELLWRCPDLVVTQDGIVGRLPSEIVHDIK